MGAIRGYMKATMIARLKTNDSTDLRARGMVIFYGRAANRRLGMRWGSGVSHNNETTRRRSFCSSGRADVWPDPRLIAQRILRSRLQPSYIAAWRLAPGRSRDLSYKLPSLLPTRRDSSGTNRPSE